MLSPDDPARWDGARFDPAHPPREGHVESYFLKLNDPEGRRALWLKATLFARPGEPALAESWAISFDREGGHRAEKQGAPLGEPGPGDVRSSFARQGLLIDAPGLHLDGAGTRGELRSGSGSIGWELSFVGDAPPLLPLPSPSLYEAAFPRSKLVSPRPDLRFDGFYSVDGVRHEVRGWRGMQGHNWGSSHTYRYAWVHGNTFAEDPDLVFEGVTARVKLGPAVSPPMTLLCVRHRGVRYDWNRWRDAVRSRGEVSGTLWRFHASSDLGTLSGEIEAPARDFVGLAYRNPTGPVTSCLNSKLARARLRFAPRGRAPLALSSESVALEFGTTGATHGVTFPLGDR